MKAGEEFDYVALVFALLALVLALLALNGCVDSQRQEHRATNQRRSYREEGTQGGVPFSKVGSEETTTDTQAEASTKTSIDTTAITDAVTIAVRGVVGVASATPLGATIAAVAGGGTTLAALIAAFLKSREAAEHKKDAAEGWAKATES